MPPKSDKLKREEEDQANNQAPSSLLTSGQPVSNGPVKIREVLCLNDFVAILQSEIESSIAMPDADSKYKNEGLVVGVGPGVADGNGSRLQPTVEIGDVVMFGQRNVIATLASDRPPYAGRKVVIVSERNLLCKLHTKIDWERFDNDGKL